MLTYFIVVKTTQNLFYIRKSTQIMNSTSRKNMQDGKTYAPVPFPWLAYSLMLQARGL